MTLYEKLVRQKIDLTAFGLEKGNTGSDYFCTPKGASVFGWAGSDGIHACFIKGFDEMVFAVSPMNAPGDYVHPLAENAEDFLRLLLACGDLALAEQIHAWSREQFNDYLQENLVSTEETAASDILREVLSLTPLEQPFNYVKEIQALFDYSRLTYKPDYYEWVPAAFTESDPPEWRVYFDGGFRGRVGRERAGKEIRVGKRFCWEDEVWHVPSVYACGAGLVMDFCVEAQPERIAAGHPLSIDFQSHLVLNGRTLRQQRGSGTAWIPDSCRPEGTAVDREARWADREARWIVDQYGLDPSVGWVFCRASFPWATRRKPVIKSLDLTLEPEPVSIPGLRCKALVPGGCVSFTHPTTGAKHTLTVLERVRQEVDRKHFPGGSQEFPTHFTVMTYTLDPDLPDQAFTLSDCCEGDRPRQAATDPMMPQGSGACAIGIIGGADGPTAVFVSTGSRTRTHAACSALHFEPVDEVEWQMMFRVKMRGNQTVAIIGSDQDNLST